MVNKLEKLNQTALSELLTKLENKLDADIFTYYGEIVNGVEREVKDIIEALANDSNKHRAIYVFLTTPGEASLQFNEWSIFCVTFTMK